MQRAQSRTVWPTPAIHTWDAWLTRQWREAVQRGATPPLQLLGASQERALWEAELARQAGEQGDELTLTVHASALMNAAARATQSRLVLSGTAQSREETLLVEMLAAVRAACAARGLLSLRLAPAESLDFLAGVRAPLLAGGIEPTAQQKWLGARFWSSQTLLLPWPAVTPVQPRLIRASEPQAELVACAAWCKARLAKDPGARLLVLTAISEPSVGIQSQLLWRALSAGSIADEPLRQRWVADEEGEPLLHQALVADALLALGLLDSAEGVEVQDVLTLLRSPCFQLGTAVETARLAAWIAEAGVARMTLAALQEALGAAASDHPAARRLAAWIAQLGEAFAAGDQGTTAWALQFATALAAGGFAATERLDPRELQVLSRWLELLDEFASLDAVLAPLPGREALARLRHLAGQARHQPAAADAAITFSGRLTDPVASYDGIWVLGLVESRWPAAPRPDAWVPLAEQRRAGWSEASASDRRRQAQWAVESWRRRTPELVLSCALQEGDVHHRPSTLVADAAWIEAEPAAQPGVFARLARNVEDQKLPACTDGELAVPLRGGALRLDTQQVCPFRAQARWRLGADAPAELSDGIPARLRGRLLHALFDHLWQQLQDQAGLLALDGAAQERLLDTSWRVAVRSTRESAWLSAGMLERERVRALRLAATVLELERQRAPFSVRHREHPAVWQGGDARLSLRIDRIDAVGDALVLLDYKSGAAPAMKLQEGALQPLQLALYADTLAQQGQAVAAAALLNLHPAKSSFAGVAGRSALLPGRLHEVADWDPLRTTWHAQLLRLMAGHVAGDATLARDRKACQRCHLPAFCRRAGADAADDAAAEGEDG